MTLLRPSHRIELINQVGRAVQAKMKVAEIPGYLRGFGIRLEVTRPVTSKWVLVRDVLANEPAETILAIARDLRVPVPGNVAPAALDLAQVLSDRGMQVCQEDFSRALETVSSDPAQAIGNACASLESICKTILDALGVPLPNDQTL